MPPALVDEAFVCSMENPYYFFSLSCCNIDCPIARRGNQFSAQKAKSATSTTSTLHLQLVSVSTGVQDVLHFVQMSVYLGVCAALCHSARCLLRMEDEYRKTEVSDVEVELVFLYTRVA